MLRWSVEKGPLASCCVNGPRGDSCLGYTNFKTVSAVIQKIQRPEWVGRGGQRSFND